MAYQINVGLLRKDSGLILLLEQLGASYAILDNSHDDLLNAFSVILINDFPHARETDQLKDYVQQGGAILDLGFSIDKFTQGTIGKKKFPYIIPGPIPFMPPLEIIDLKARVKTFSKAQYLGKTLFLEEYGNGLISFLGFSLEKLLFDPRSQRKAFYASSPRFPNEEIALVSKGEIVRIFFYLLRHLHTVRDCPWVHKWFFPNQAKNVFLFRIDSDYGSQKQIEQWYELAYKHNIRFTWFLHTAAHHDWLDLFSQFEKHEIASHGYEHFTSKKYSENQANIQKAHRVLKSKGFMCKGYAAPYGLWNEQLSALCQELGFLYTSEFSYIYDSLPMTPMIKGKVNPVLQIPIHPICMGNLIAARAREQDIIEYFTHAFSRMMRHCNPLIFYDHVLHSQTSLLADLFQQIQKLNLPSLTFSAYAQWWNKRTKAHFSAFHNGKERLKVNHTLIDQDVSLAIWPDNDNCILTTNHGSIDVSSTQPMRVNDYQYDYEKNSDPRVRKGKLRLYKITLLNNLLWRKYH